jgi:uncharacterized protein (DUF342 family)
MPETRPKEFTIDGSLEKSWTCEGSLTVRRDILPKLKIHVMGNLVVQGVVQGSEIVVEKDAWLEGGILGQNQGRITVHGHLKTRQIVDAYVECDKSVEVYDSIINASVRAKEAIKVGNNICGGEVLAEHSILAKSVGCTDKKVTKVESGANFRLKIMQEEMSRELLEITEKADKIRAAVNQLENKEKTHYAGLSFQEKKLLKSSKDSMTIFEKQLEGLNLRKQKFERKLEKTLAAFIEVQDKIFPGTQICIQNRFVVAQKEYPAGRYTIREGKICRL